jgi:hypothetical protein
MTSFSRDMRLVELEGANGEQYFVNPEAIACISRSDAETSRIRIRRRQRERDLREGFDSGRRREIPREDAPSLAGRRT